MYIDSALRVGAISDLLQFINCLKLFIECIYSRMFAFSWTKKGVLKVPTYKCTYREGGKNGPVQSHKDHQLKQEGFYLLRKWYLHRFSLPG